jgi:hypothetical protein
MTKFTLNKAKNTEFWNGNKGLADEFIVMS